MTNVLKHFHGVAAPWWRFAACLGGVAVAGLCPNPVTAQVSVPIAVAEDPATDGTRTILAQRIEEMGKQDELEHLDSALVQMQEQMDRLRAFVDAQTSP